MNMSTGLSPGELLEKMAPAARAKFASDAGWAKAAGLPKETLSRLKSQPSCDLRTLDALARAAGYALAPVRPEAMQEAGDHLPRKFGREHEEVLLDLASSRNVDRATWCSRGPAFFMGGLAVMLGSARGFDRERYLRLAESLHPGVSTPEVFALWLDQSPVRPSRFLPMVRKRKRIG